MRARSGFLTGLTLLLTALLLMAGSANAALLSRAGGLAYYDTVLDLTWLADANAGAGSSYDDGGSTSDGRMSWYSAQAWIDSLNSANHLGVNNWRLPQVADTGNPGCDWAYAGTDCGYNVLTGSAATTVYSEMASLYYDTLGNPGYYDASGNDTGGSCYVAPAYCLTSTGPFPNIQTFYYWSGTTFTYAPDPGNAWYFDFYDGFQLYGDKNSERHAWAVSPGDTVVPIPGVAWLLVGAFGGLGARALRRKAGTG